ncbi:MAG: hypothetical protein IJ752_00670 [Alphaproteobacteria bacterium]|nr:hypothetical protein [Alphaproteobacteria bacterium]
MAETDRIEKKHEKSKIRKAAQKDESSITFYLHASLFLFFLTAYTFLLFLYKNKYPLILNNEILPEVLFACFGLLVFSFLSLFLLSFWRLLARLFIAAIAGGAVAYILGLLYPFNIGNYFAHYVSFLPQNVLMYIADNGNQVIAVAAGVFFFILLNMFKGGAMAFLSLPVLAAIFMLLNTASKQVMPEKFQTADATADRTQEKDENLIYLLLADHTGYGIAAESWQMLNSKNANPTALSFSPTFILSFYQSNNFTFYPSAYLRYQDKYRNIGDVLNPSLTEINNDLFNRDDAVYYIGSDDAMVSAARNDLFTALKNKGYHLNIYQSYPFNFCNGAGAKDIASCVTYPAPLGALYQTSLTTPSRLMLLAGHWLYSTPFGKQAAKYIYDKIQKKMDASSLPLLGNPMSKSLPIGQSLILSHLRQDILKAKGKNVFFIHLNLPHYPYVYDKNCQLRLDPETWRSKAPYTDKKELNGELKRWEDYNQQLFCTYAQINYLIKDLEKAKLLDKTTIVIHGEKGADIQKETAEEKELTRVEKMINRFKNNMTTVFGVYTPKNKAKTELATCDVATLVDRHVLGNSADICQPPDFAAYTREEQDKSMAWLVSPISENYLKAGKFDPLYSDWLENGGQAYIASLEERLKKEAENTASSKISFVAPPSFMDNASKPEEMLVVREKTTDFVPVPQKEEPVAVPPPPAAEKAKTPDLKTEPLADLLVHEASSQTETLPVEAAILPSTAEPAPEQALQETLPTLDLIVDDFGELPKPIVLPESSAEDKWKATDIKDGQKTTLELLPSEVTGTEELPAVLPESPEVLPEIIPDLPAPQAAPAAQVEILPLPVLNPQTTPTASLPEQPVTEQTPVIKQETQSSAVQPTPVAESVSAPPVPPQPEETEQVKAAQEAQTQAEAQVQAMAAEEAEAIAEAKAQIKAAEEAKARAEAAAQARAKAEEEARLKAEAEAQTRAQEEARIQAEAEAQIKAAQEAKAKAESAAQARAKAEAEAKAKAEETARIKAEEEAKAKAEAETQIKAAQEAQAKAKAAAKAAKAKAEEEERRKAEEAEREEMRKKTPPPPPANADELDIIKETLVERVNEDGEVETFIYLERKPNPNRFKKKPQQERELQQQDLVRTPAEQTAPAAIPQEPVPVPQPEPSEQTASSPAQQPVSSEIERENAAVPPAAPVQPAVVERVLDD